MDGERPGSRPSAGVPYPPWQAQYGGAPAPWPSTPQHSNGPGAASGLSKGLLAALATAIGVVAMTFGVAFGMLVMTPAPATAPQSDQAQEESTSPQRPSTRTETAALENAVETCAPDSDFIRIADEGRTVIATGVGVQGAADDSVDQLVCVLALVGAPESLVAHISATRALDGRQEEVFGEYTASWIYHPDNGLDLTIVLND